MNDTIFNGTTPSRMQERVEVVKKTQQEYHFVGQVLKRAGHTLFEYNRRTHKVRIADISNSAAMTVYGYVQHETRCNANNECIYLQALNIKNAAKKLRKSGFEVKDEKKK